MEWINSRIKRPAYYWWNYPVTDYIRNFILQGPVYGLDTSLTKENVCGVVSNPMEHGEASKLALYGVADYTWNIANYNPIDSWERGLQELTPKPKMLTVHLPFTPVTLKTDIAEMSLGKLRHSGLQNGMMPRLRLLKQNSKNRKSPG